MTTEQVFYFEEIPIEKDDDEKCTKSLSYEVLSDINDIQAPPKRGGATMTTITTQQGSMIYLIGGANREADAFNDVHLFNLEDKTWMKLKPVHSTLFKPRSGHSAVANGHSIYVFGGANLKIGEVYNDVLVLDTVTLEWRQLYLTGDIPVARSSHSAETLPEGMFIFGGSSPEVGPMNDAYILSWNEPEVAWKRIDYDYNRVAKRELHVSCVWLGKVYITGGRLESGQLCSDLSILDTASWTWQHHTVQDWHRCAHVSGLLDGKWIHYGGWDGSQGFVDDCWELDLSFDESPRMLPVNLHKVFAMEKQIELNLEESQEEPHGQGRFAHCACVVKDNQLAIFGGMSLAEDFNDLSILCTRVE